MENITFECEVITPMFLAGADGSKPELRAPSIKGAMRFWWRAMNANLVENKNGKWDYSKLMEEEANIFGSSEEKIGKSKFSIRIKDFEKFIKEKLSDYPKYPPLPHKKNFNNPCLSPSIDTFIIEISSRQNISSFSDTLKVSLILGGFGKRRRRGFGSIKINKINNLDYKSPVSLQEINSLLNNIDNNFKVNSNKISLVKSNKANYPFIQEIEIGKVYPSMDELLEEIGKATHNYNFDSLGFAKRDGSKLASPIYVSILKISKNEYKPIITSLNTVFENVQLITPNQLKEQQDFRRAIL